MEYTEKGFLTVSVCTAKGAIPIKGARVKIYGDNNGIFGLIKNYVTDASGKTPTAELGAPPFELSQTPDSRGEPFASYLVHTDYEGYYSVENIGVPIYPGIKAYQNVSLVPLASGILPDGFTETRYNESQAPDL